MEAHAAFVRANGVVELHAVAEVYVRVAAIVNPGHFEGKDAVGFYEPLDETHALELGMLVIDVFNREEHFAHCLQVLFFTRMLCFQILQD